MMILLRQQQLLLGKGGQGVLISGNETKRRCPEVMESGFKVCPKCNGKGIMKYRVWESRWIISNLSRLKNGQDFAPRAMFNISITCPGCDGSGKSDWISEATKASILRTPFAKLEGNMDIYFYRAIESWPPNCPTHKLSRPRVFKFTKHVDKLLKKSQERYTGIKLNEEMLTLSSHDLSELFDRLFHYEAFLLSLPQDEVTEERIKAELVTLGLRDYMPDRFVYPGPDDFPMPQ
jgi:hypothetical protein